MLNFILWGDYMSENKLSNTTNNSNNNNFHIPRWEELPNIDLYIDQVVCLLENYLSYFIKNDLTNSKHFITKTMINNYVKHGVINSPVSKKYNKEHIAYLIVIFILKQIYSIEEIKKLLDLAITTSSINISYNRFCLELESAIQSTFSKKINFSSSELSKEQYLLRNVVLSFSNKLYVQKNFLSN